MLNKDEERDVKEDYDIVMKIEESTVDCNINNTNNCDNNFILDETLIKTENREITKNEYFDGTMSDNENKIFVLEIKNEEIPYYTKLNNDEVTKYDNFNYDEMVHNMYPTCNKNYTVYDSEDEIILNKQTYSKESQKRKKKSNNDKKYMQNDSAVKYEDTYKIVPLTDQEEEDWLKIERMDVTFLANEFKCEKCILHWKSKEKMIRHDSTFHNRMTDNKCVYCDAYFQNSSALRVHQDSRHCKLYVCVFCNTKYHTRKTMYDHYDEKHNNTFQCKECPVSFGKSYLVREHYKQMHEQFECDYCKKVLPTKQKLITHIGAKHQIFCDICYKEFPVRKQLSYHKATKHKIKEDETTFCVECNKQFTCALKYTIHIQHSKLHRMQNGQPPLYTQSTCPVCKKVFFNKTIMENHYNYVHLKKYNFTCDICYKNFVSGTKLSRHKKRCHLGIKPARDKMCNICGRGFPENYRLKSHMLTHTGERPFECPHCSSRFSQKGALSLHIKKVHVKKEIE